MAYASALPNTQWALVAHLFDSPRRRSPRAAIPRRQLVEAMLFIACTGCQWRCLPDRYGTLDGGVGPVAALARLRRVGADHAPAGSRDPIPQASALDALDAHARGQAARGARYGPTFHEAGGRGGSGAGAG